MPRFDYLCADCTMTFEHLLPAGSPPPPCLQCGSANVQKLLAPPPVIFKGSGFFKTDSAKSGAPKKEVPKKEEAKKTDSPTPGERENVEKKPNSAT